MRFFPECPDIPGELIESRDKGKVVFFCGAGVSLARAGLPSFYQLTERVLGDLGAAPESDAFKLFRHMAEVEAASGISGTLSPDRVFGLLERDFTTEEINRSVSRLLSPSETADLSAHRAMLKLADHEDRGVRLVTTNFDRLFDAAQPGLVSHEPKSIQALSDSDEWGVIHLHGRLGQEGTDEHRSSFVLSTGAFGDAYLANGWAREFVQRVMRDHITVFVGYAADDPPLRYLLEGIKAGQGHRRRAFAFQSATDRAAIASWEDKGVTPIVYGHGHETLWRALEAWADQAVEPVGWASRVIERSREGPSDLQAFERGQFAQVIGTKVGAELLAAAEPPPPADWLCVMDPSLRFRVPGKQTEGPFRFDGPEVDPFSLYRLDNDPTPKVSSSGIEKTMEVPKEAWDGFRANATDLEDMSRESVASLRGFSSDTAPKLPPRLWSISVWISKIADQPAAPWWASRQHALHPELQQLIALQLQRGDDDPTQAVIRYAWQLIFEAWRERPNGWRDLYDLKSALKRTGWNDASVREFRRVSAAYLKIRNPYFGPLPPLSDEGLTIRHLVHTDVGYPEGYSDIKINADVLRPVVAQFRGNLERAAELEQAQSYLRLCAIRPDEAKDGDNYTRHHDLSAYALYYLELFNRLREINLEAAKAELACWQSDDEVFTRLRIWAAGESDLTKPARAAATIHRLPDDDFWDSHHQRDLLLSLQMRWSEMSLRDRSRISKRILRGRKRWANEDIKDHRIRRAYGIVSRLYWLQDQGCQLPFNLDEATAKHRAVIPDWEPNKSESAAEDMDGRSGWVVDDTDCSGLEGLPITEILSKAGAIMRQHNDHHSNARPFSGLLRSKPMLAFNALVWSSSQGDYPVWAWEALLNLSDNEQPIDIDAERIADALISLPSGVLAEFAHTACRWLRAKSKKLADTEPVFSQLWNKALDAIIATPDSQKSGILRQNDQADWIMEAINSPPGNLTDALFGTSHTDDLGEGTGLPVWLREKLDRLLALDGDPKGYVLARLTLRLNWLHFVDPTWTKRSILQDMTVTGRDSVEYEASWAGLLWAKDTPTVALYGEIRDELLLLPRPRSRNEHHEYESLAAFLFVAWRPRSDGPPLVSDADLRAALLSGDEQFREQMIWIIDHWTPDDVSEWAPLVKKLIVDVWPKQLRANSPDLSRRWLEFLFSNPGMFGEVSEALLTKLRPVSGQDIWLRGSHGFAQNVTPERAEAIINVLEVVLAEDRASWPYGTGDVLNLLQGYTLPKRSTEKLQKLKRRKKY